MNVVITGGSSGLGKAMAHEFCKREHSVLICGRNITRLKDATNYISSHKKGNVYVYQCDVRDYKQVAKLGDYANYIFNDKIDHWINNSATCEGPIDFDELSLEDISNIVSTNVLGTVYGIKVAYNLKARNIYTVSGHGSNGNKTENFAMYGASKALISQLTATLAEELKGSNINIIAPGLMRTPLTDKLLNNTQYNTISKNIFRLLCKDPKVIARRIVPKILSCKGNNNFITGY
jgi:chlorophyll(ide) b reductase